MTRARLIILAAIAGLFVWLFADALFGSGVFVFRDSGHFYYPLFQFVKSEWLAGRVPLWNPYENLGVPLAAGGSSSVFYPGKLIFFLPMDYATAYVWYVMGHVLLAAWAAYRLARVWGGSVEAAGVAALSYAFSGNVLYQYCNVIFLVGAAWLPLAMLAAHRMLDGERATGNKERATGNTEQDQARRLRPAGQGSQFRWAIAFGAVLAMMVLGGNAEMAYHAGLLAAMYAGWLWWSERPARKEPARKLRPGSTALVTSRPVLLAFAGAMAFALSAVQVLPSAEFTARSQRAASSVPRSLYELAGFLLKTAGAGHAAQSPDARWGDGLTCRRLEPGSHQEHLYDFSVGPWRLAEYVWPNVSGRQFPVHRRWLDVVPAEGRVWVPSLYMGLVPLVLAIASMRFRRGDALRSWLTWTVVLAVAASFGWYGLGWLAQELRAAAGADVSKPWLVGGPFGGLYWLATLVLPGYVYFRYPAKLLVIAALGLSMLAAIGWDRAMAGQSVRLRRGLVWLAAVSVLGAGAALAIRPFWDGWLSGVAPDVMFGPLDTAGAFGNLLTRLVQTAVVGLAFWWLLRRASSGARWPAAAAIVLVAVDLGVANGWLVVCAPAEQWSQQPALAAAIQRQEGRGQGPGARDQGSGKVESRKSRVESQEARHLQPSTLNTQPSSLSRRTQPAGLLPQPSTLNPQPSTLNPQPSTLDPQPYRVYRQRLWTPPSWSRQSSDGRMAEAARWDRDTLWPKYNLAVRVPLAEVYGTMSLYDYEVFAARRGPPPLAARIGPDAFSWSNVKYFILRGEERLPEGTRIELDGKAAGVEDVSLWLSSERLPRAWIVHRVEVLGRCPAADPGEIRRRTDRVFVADGGPRNLLQSAAVEPDGRFEVPPSAGADRWAPSGGWPPERQTAGEEATSELAAAPPANAAESCRVTHYDPLCVQIEATLSRPGLVVLCDQFYPGWRLEVETAGQLARQLPILRANRVMRGAWLPAGEHRLTYRYRPASFLLGGAITAVAWIGLAGFIVLRSLSARRANRKRRG